jgi:hypothetical protein
MGTRLAKTKRYRNRARRIGAIRSRSRSLGGTNCRLRAFVLAVVVSPACVDPIALIFRTIFSGTRPCGRQLSRS